MLLTAELKSRFLEVGDQSEVEDPVIIAHYFNPAGAGDRYAFSYDDVDQIFYGYVSIFKDWNDECGSFSLQELEQYKNQFGLSIERDRYRTEIPFSALKKYNDL